MRRGIDLYQSSLGRDGTNCQPAHRMVKRMPQSKTLVICYSRTGTTRKLAEALAAALGADLEDIKDLKGRQGPIGWIRSIVEAIRQRPAPIAAANADPSAYQMVMIATPVWAGAVSSPVRSYLLLHAHHLRAVGFFCTLGGSGAEGAFAQMEQLTGHPPQFCLAVKAKDVSSGNYRARVTALVAGLKNRGAAPDTPSGPSPQSAAP